MSAVQNEIDGVFQRVRQRDRQAFERLYVLTHRRLYGVLMNIVADREVAADLLQEGYLNIWFASARDEVTFPWAWMCQVMRHLAIDHIRQHGVIVKSGV